MNLATEYTPNAIDIIISNKPIIALSFNAKKPTISIIAITAIKNNKTEEKLLKELNKKREKIK